MVGMVVVAATRGFFMPPHTPRARAPRVVASASTSAEARVMTLTRFMIDVSRKDPSLQDLEDLMSSVQMACKTIASLVPPA